MAAHRCKPPDASRGFAPVGRPDVIAGKQRPLILVTKPVKGEPSRTAVGHGNAHVRHCWQVQSGAKKSIP